MKILLQRVSQAEVIVDAKSVGKIAKGLLALVCFEKGDDEQTLQQLADKMLACRIFSDSDDKMNWDVRRIDGDIMLIPQFTLAADTNTGNRPSFSRAAAPKLAQELFTALVAYCTQTYKPVAQGIFAAEMQVHLCNDGPVTIMLNA